MQICDRRLALAMLGAAASAPLFPARLLAADSFVMWRDPGCGCCLAWAKRMEAAFGKRLPVVDAADMAAIKRARGVPAALRSCHTALIHGYAVEGHVPPADVRRLIAARTAGITGLAVPGMPLGAPGMEHGEHRDPYKVFAFGPGRRPSVFAIHGASR
jgi:hypothetical protein